MDPNEALRQILISIDQWDASDQMPDHETQFMMFESTRAMHEWLSRGGFLPAAWEAAPPEYDDGRMTLEPVDTGQHDGHPPTWPFDR